MAGRGRVNARVSYNNRSTVFYQMYDTKEEIRSDAKKKGLSYHSTEMSISFTSGGYEVYERHGSRWYRLC